MRNATWLFCAAVSASFSACGNVDMMGSGNSTLEAALAEGELENQRHADGCAAAVSMGTMVDEIDRHEATMGDIVDRMDDARERMIAGWMRMGMRHCRGPRFERMSGTLDDLQREMSDHVSRMRSIAELTDAQGDCAAHTDSMGTMMRSMASDLRSMLCGG